MGYRSKQNILHQAATVLLRAGYYCLWKNFDCEYLRKIFLTEEEDRGCGWWGERVYMRLVDKNG
jgi:hypothetical protein